MVALQQLWGEVVQGLCLAGVLLVVIFPFWILINLPNDYGDKTCLELILDLPAQLVRVVKTISSRGKGNGKG